jgi:glycosyltransferase involved in cell wall biosynthesis
MKIAIVNQHFHIGGVETFLLSLVRQFGLSGHDVHLFLVDMEGPNALLAGLRSLGVRVQGLDELPCRGSQPEFDIALVTNPETLFKTLRMLERGDLKARSLVVGVYQTRMFCLDRGPLNLHNRLTRKVFSRMPVRNVIFGNDACRDEHARTAPAMARSPIIPLIVDGEKFARRMPLESSSPRRIVSIGRLDHFKTYNLTMLEVIRRLRELGHDVCWDVYGTGMLQPQMERRIAELGLSDAVRLLGNIDYRAIPRALADAFAFVGSGLSMMEAAACGVPALPAIEYDDKPETFGFPNEIDGISFFEPGLPLARRDIGDKLLELIRMPPDRYEALADAGRHKMSIFFAPTVADRYIEVFQGAESERPLLGAVGFAMFDASAKLHRDGLAMFKRLRLRKR